MSFLAFGGGSWVAENRMRNFDILTLCSSIANTKYAIIFLSENPFVVLPSDCFVVDRDDPFSSLLPFRVDDFFLVLIVFQSPFAVDQQRSSDSGDRCLISEFILHHDRDVAAIGKKEEGAAVCPVVFLGVSEEL